MVHTMKSQMMAFVHLEIIVLNHPQLQNFVPMEHMQMAQRYMLVQLNPAIMGVKETKNLLLVIGRFPCLFGPLQL